MALRDIVKEPDERLRKVCRPVKEITPHILTLLDDMAETMAYAEGVGLAAPQVGVLRRIVVVDVGEGLIELINPEIIEKDGEVSDSEGCLSIPGKYGEVVRPAYVKVKALNRQGEEAEYEGTELLARAFCHEIDHLDGILYIDRAQQVWETEE